MTTGVLGLAFDLMRSSGVDPDVLRRLVDQSVSNAFDLGPDAALTGPVSRGDAQTVSGQLGAVGAVDPGLAAEFDLLVEFLRSRVGQSSS